MEGGVMRQGGDQTGGAICATRITSQALQVLAMHMVSLVLSASSTTAGLRACLAYTPEHAILIICYSQATEGCLRSAPPAICQTCSHTSPGLLLQAEGGVQQDDGADPKAAGQRGHLLFGRQPCPGRGFGSPKAGIPFILLSCFSVAELQQ